MHSTSEIKVLVIDQDAIRSDLIREGLIACGYEAITVISEVDGLDQKIHSIAPDVIIVDLQNPNRDLVEHIFRISRPSERPVAMFVDRSDAVMLAAAMQAGVSAYVVDGLRKDRVSAILDMAIARFDAYARLRQELRETREALADRAAIDKAKALLMRTRGIAENDAYHRLRRTAMQQNQRMGDVARALLLSEEMMFDGQERAPVRDSKKNPKGESA